MKLIPYETILLPRQEDAPEIEAPMFLIMDGTRQVGTVITWFLAGLPVGISEEHAHQFLSRHYNGANKLLKSGLPNYIQIFGANFAICATWKSGWKMKHVPANEVDELFLEYRRDKPFRSAVC